MEIRRRRLFLLLMSLALMVSGTAFGAGAAPGKDPVPDLSQAQWLVLGTFDDPPAKDVWWDYEGFHRDYLEAAGGETQVRFKKDQTIAGRKVIPSAAKNGMIDFLWLYPKSNNTVAYAYLEISSPRAQKVALKLGSDDGIKVWLNGALIWSNHSHWMVVPDHEAVAADLKRGVNRLLVKVEQMGGGWGFSARMRSLADEAADWARVKQPVLQTIAPHTLIAEKGQAWCVVDTLPAFVVPEPVTLLIFDGDGKQLASRKGTVGEPIALQLPADYEGIISIQAVGGGKLSGIKCPLALALVGNYRKMTANAIADAQAISKAFVYDSKSEDLGATVTFLADQLEGKHHQSLITPERNLRAIQSIDAIKKALKQGSWHAAALRGIRQWAYRSEIDDSCQPYTVYLPESYDPQKPYRLLLTLHGHTNDDHHAVKALCDYYLPEDFVIVGAYGRGDMDYLTFGEQDVLDVLGRVRQIYNIDPDEVYLMGESMGGLGTWRLGQFYADRFAAIAPFCGWTGTQYLENLRNLPVRIVHGDADPMVPYYMDEAAAGRLKELGYDFLYDKFPGAGHGIWDYFAEKNGGKEIFDYFRQHRRNPWPVEVNARVNYVRYGRQYWVQIKELAKPLTAGTIHASVKGSREMNVATKGVSSLILDLRHPMLEQTGTVNITMDNQTFAVTAGQEAALFDFSKESGWRAGNPASPGVSSKTAPHLGGGMIDAFYGPVIFIYGTGRAERSPILKSAAEKLADFSVTPLTELGSKVGRFPIKADTEVSEAELKSHSLFLVGNAEENRITAALTSKWGKEFPVQLVGDDLWIVGQEFKKMALGLAYPNPWATEFLACFLTLPFGKEAIEQYAAHANLPFYARPLTDIATEPYIVPDVLVFDLLQKKPVQAAWSFNREWKELTPLTK